MDLPRINHQHLRDVLAETMGQDVIWDRFEDFFSGATKEAVVTSILNRGLGLLEYTGIMASIIDREIVVVDMSEETEEGAKIRSYSPEMYDLGELYYSDNTWNTIEYL